jgi:hypothetical protein
LSVTIGVKSASAVIGPADAGIASLRVQSRTADSGAHGEFVLAAAMQNLKTLALDVCTQFRANSLRGLQRVS